MIKKAIISISKEDLDLVPSLSTLPKELWSLGGISLIQRIVSELKDSEIEEIIIVVPHEKKILIDYLKELTSSSDLFKGIKFSYVTQKNSLGHGHSILQSEKMMGEDNFGFSLSDNLIHSKSSCFSQLTNVFRTSQKPVVALRRAGEGVSAFGYVKVEKIANRFFKIKSLVDEIDPGDDGYEFVLTGRGVLTPTTFDYLRKIKASKTKIMTFARALDIMIKDGKTIYGYEIEGQWLQCNNRVNLVKSDPFLSLNDQDFGPDLKKYLN
jgi:UTP--glucose-1-phosphate uridylyltransferase